MNINSKLIVFLLMLFPLFLSAQKSTAVINGIVHDENENPLSGVNIIILGKTSGTSTREDGSFSLTVPAGRAIALVFSYAGYKTLQKNFLLNADESDNIIVRMERGTGQLQTVVVTDQSDRTEAGLIRINPKNALILPSASGGIESLIKIIVGSNNELTSQYSVRGGNYDENLIYVNDFEVFRPYLVRSGQQEGLSFINPEMVRSVNFYNGGFQSKYGDKMSSVLDIRYKQPGKFAGTFYTGLLEQGLHLEGSSKNRKFSYITGVRNRSNRNLLSSQETKGNYVPSSYDWQTLLTFQPSSRWELELLNNISQTRFTLEPEFSQPSSSVFSPYFTANLGLDIYFQGRETDKYTTWMTGISATQKVNDWLKLKWMLSRFSNKESESVDIMGAYLFGEREFDKSQPDFGLINNPLGAGLFHQFARNRLDIEIWNASHKGSYRIGKHFYQWGLTVERNSINDRINEWELQDSAGYSLPYNPDQIVLNKVLKSQADLQFIRFSGYIQDNLLFNELSPFTLQAGLRFNYSGLNKELLLSPRIQMSYSPAWERDVIFRAAVGAYHQPPFYRELRRPDGTLNEDLEAQKSWQVTAGLDYNFTVGALPFRFTTEAYYKSIADAVTYDVENLRLRYSGENNAKAYAAGLEFRLFGELVKDAESWLSLGFMKTKENLHNDYYYNYELDEQNIPVDSTQMEGGWFRRPTDRLITVGMFFQDYLSTNKNFKVYVNGLYGSNMPYNIPNSVKYRNALIIDPYIRIDLGFSVLLLDNEIHTIRSRSPFRNFKNIWFSLEVFNIIDRPNTISYMLIKDFANNVFSIPNRLTPRLLNAKLVMRF